jgi:hypothetical protein
MYTAWLVSVGAELLGKFEGLLGAASVLQGRAEMRRQVKAQVIENHRRVQEVIRSLPGAEHLFDPNRDLAAYPRTGDETYCVRLMLVNFAFALSESRAGRYDLPEKLPEDVRSCLSCPAWKDAWEELLPFQSKKDIAYVTKIASPA